MISRIKLVWLVAAFLCGCAVTLRAGRPTLTERNVLQVPERAASRCMHGTAGRSDTPSDAYVPLSDSLLPYLARFTPEVRRTARAAGLEVLLARVVRGSEHADVADERLELLSLRDELASQMFALETQLLAIEFEVDCVRGLLNDVLGDYEEAETDRQLDWTIVSLVVGACAAVASSAWDLANGYTASPAWSDGPLVTAIAGAVATTAIGVVVVLPPPQEITYIHERNVLTPLLEGQDPQHIYPSSVFRLLTLPEANGGLSPRDELIASFHAQLDDMIAADQRSLAHEIIFGVGGVHDVRLLTVHQDLLEELGATLDGLARDIDALGNAVAVLLRARSTGQLDVAPSHGDD